MTEQQQQHEDPSCAVDLSASALPEDKKQVEQEEVFTTTIEPSSTVASTTVASTTEVTTTEITADEAKSEPQSGFDGFGFSEALLKTLADKGYSDPFTDPKGSVSRN
jgi:ATP-dependent RNA helicase DeaD